ncbi:hypothetical protein RHA1_ro10004 (plasmid) [Rhodococcus jostii RHA1]|uniref:Uncharacterized protein n=1 Tax=Rhodococcus jostii (strain RHA1) TaxID=101510 RepID=Q0RWY9_RHOJR|nr:hypothetical protein RHA1_ro10004 [Rhodococcus jostii RHA1]
MPGTPADTDSAAPSGRPRLQAGHHRVTLNQAVQLSFFQCGMRVSRAVLARVRLIHSDCASGASADQSRPVSVEQSSAATVSIGTRRRQAARRKTSAN